MTIAWERAVRTFIVVTGTGWLFVQVLEWCEVVKPEDAQQKQLYFGPTFRGQVLKKRKKILFDTSSQHYFKVLKKLLWVHGYDVIDRGDRDLYDEHTCPRLVYHSTTTGKVQ